VHCWWEFKMENSVAEFLQQPNTELPYYPAIPLIRIDPQRTESWDPHRCYTYNHVQTAVFTAAKS